jgi:hypothetical protein
MSKETTLATFKVSPVLWDGFKVWATTHGTNAAEVLRWLLKECLDGRVTAPSGDNQGATVGLDERIALQIDEAVVGIDLRIDDRVNEAIAPLRVELAELRCLVESMNSAPTTHPPHDKPEAAIDDEPPPKWSRRHDGSISDATARGRARNMGWSKATGESVEVFLGRLGWRREGTGVDARWFPPPQG